MKKDKPTRLLAFLLLIICTPLWSDHDKVPRVVFVADNHSGNYQPILKGFREYTRKHAGRLIRTDLIINENLTAAKLEKQLENHYNLIIPLGINTAKAVLTTSQDIDIFALLVNQSELRALYKSEKRNKRSFSGIYRDQPFHRFAALIQQALPKHRNVGILLGSNSKTLKPYFDQTMEKFGLKPKVTIVRNNDLPQRVLERLALKSEVIIAVFDDSIYSPENIKSHLLTTFRYQIPVIGVTKSYTEVGAFASIYTDRYELGKQAGKQILKMLDLNDKDIEPVYPETFAIKTNPFVTRSFGVKELDENALIQAIRQSDGDNQHQ